MDVLGAVVGAGAGALVVGAAVLVPATGVGVGVGAGGTARDAVAVAVEVGAGAAELVDARGVVRRVVDVCGTDVDGAAATLGAAAAAVD